MVTFPRSRGAGAGSTIGRRDNGTLPTTLYPGSSSVIPRLSSPSIASPATPSGNARSAATLDPSHGIQLPFASCPRTKIVVSTRSISMLIGRPEDLSVISTRIASSAGCVSTASVKWARADLRRYAGCVLGDTLESVLETAGAEPQRVSAVGGGADRGAGGRRLRGPRCRRWSDRRAGSWRWGCRWSCRGCGCRGCVRPRRRRKRRRLDGRHWRGYLRWRCVLPAARSGEHDHAPKGQGDAVSREAGAPRRLPTHRRLVRCAGALGVEHQAEPPRRFHVESIAVAGSTAG